MLFNVAMKQKMWIVRSCVKRLHKQEKCRAGLDSVHLEKIGLFTSLDR